MSIIFQKWITRKDLRDNPNSIYVFGDNAQRYGMGGQAKEMRGEPNALGVATKRSPGMNTIDFFHDVHPKDWMTISADLNSLVEQVLSGRTVILPSDGLGTGLSKLPTVAPLIYEMLYWTVDAHSENIPWELPGKSKSANTSYSRL